MFVSTAINAPAQRALPDKLRIFGSVFILTVVSRNGRFSILIPKVVLLVVIIVTLGSTGVSAQTVTGFKTGEYTAGMMKECFYDALGSSYTRMIRAVELCRLSIQVHIEQE